MAKVLIVDDSPDLVLLLSIFIKTEGHEAMSLTSPVALIEKLVEYDPDLIILDVNIGRYNGKEVCKHIKTNATGKNIPVLLMSGSAESLADFKDFYADDILEKPFDSLIIINKINRLLSKSKNTIHAERVL